MSRAVGHTGLTGDALDRCLHVWPPPDSLYGTDFNTDPTKRASLLIYSISSVHKSYRFLRALLRTFAALVAQHDVKSLGARKPADVYRRLLRVVHAEIHVCTG